MTALQTAPEIGPGALIHPAHMMPADLTAVERNVYRVAHARACVAYNRKHGGAGVTAEEYGGTWPADGSAAARELATELARRGAAHRAAQWPVAHAAGMRALRKYLKDHGQPDRAAAIVDPAKPAKRGRKSPARVLAAVPAPEPAPVDTTAEPADTAPEVSAELAAGVDSGRVTVVHVGPWPPAPGAAVAVPELAPEPTPAELEQDTAPDTAEPASTDDTAPEPVRPLSDVAAAVAIGRHLRDTWPEPVTTRAERAAVRRELANRLRACGILPAGMAWRMAADTATGTDTAGGADR